MTNKELNNETTHNVNKETYNIPLNIVLGVQNDSRQKQNAVTL